MLLTVIIIPLCCFLTTKKQQIKVFREQLELAKDLNLPVVIHNRDSDEDLYDNIKNSKVDKGVIHSLDLDSMDYKPMKKKKYAAFSIAKENIYLSDRLNSVVRVDDLAGEFLWTCFAKSLALVFSEGAKNSAPPRREARFLFFISSTPGPQARRTTRRVQNSGLGTIWGSVWARVHAFWVRGMR